jgi:hypothetical protein
VKVFEGVLRCLGREVTVRGSKEAEHLAEGIALYTCRYQDGITQETRKNRAQSASNEQDEIATR